MLFIYGKSRTSRESQEIAKNFSEEFSTKDKKEMLSLLPGKSLFFSIYPSFPLGKLLNTIIESKHRIFLKKNGKFSYLNHHKLEVPFKTLVMQYPGYTLYVFEMFDYDRDEDADALNYRGKYPSTVSII